MAAKRAKKTETPETEAPQAEVATPKKTRSRKQATTTPAADGRAAASTGTGKTRAGKTTSKAAPTREQIERRAYEIYEQRGGQHGLHEDDWLQAERELRESGS